MCVGQARQPEHSRGAGCGVLASHGTGAYAGIGGTGKLSYVFAGLAPRYATGPKKGQCNLSNNTQPTASYSSVTGTLDVQLP